MKRKHIAFYISSLSKGGSERVFVNLAEYFYTSGYEVTMVTQYQKENEYPYNKGIHRVLSDLTDAEDTGNRIGNFYSRFMKLRKIWKERKPDIILSCIGKNNFMAVITSLFLQSKTVVSVVGEPSEEYPTFWLKWIANIVFVWADGMVVKTNDALKFFPGYLHKKAIVMKNSINPAFLREPYMGSRAKTIVSVGRLDANKNQSMLITAFSKIEKEYPEYNLFLYGEGEDRKKLEDMVADLGLLEKIFLPGIVEDVAATIYKAGIFVLTSNTEGMPNALIEAMALGIPCISTDCPCGGPKDLIIQYENGILVPVNDSDELEQELRRLMDNPELADKIGKNAAKIQKQLDPAIINKTWEQYFNALIK